MDNKIKCSINNLPKYMNIILFVFPFIGLIFIQTALDNDFYFLYKMGEYISNIGFPTHDILSMHNEMELVVQQWLCDVLFYKIYDSYSVAGMVAFVALVYVAFVFVYYRLCKLITNNFFVSIIATTVSSILISVGFFTTRPQIVTYLVFLLLFYALELYIKTKKVYWLSVLPLLSLFLINWHASMWWLLFVFMLPYLVNAVPIKFKKFRQEPCCNIFALLLTMLIMFCVGFINPYGKDAVTYLFGSYGVDQINAFIQEMKPTSLAQPQGKMLFVIIAIMIVIFAFYPKNNIKLRFLGLTLGTVILSLSSLKGMAYFFICAFFSLAYFLKDLDFDITVTNSKRTKKEKIKLAVLVIVFVLLLGCLCFILSNRDNYTNDENESKDKLDEIITVLNEYPKEDIVLYNDFNTGQYLEFNGYKAYIDGRAEVFLEKNNKNFDYFVEWCDFNSGKLYYKDFVDKYNFTHLIVDKSSVVVLEQLKHDSNYDIIYQNDMYVLFELKGWDL